MAQPMRFRVTTGPEWKRVADELLVQNKELGERFIREMRNSGDDLAKLAQNAVMRIPTHTSQHSGLRLRIAKGVGTKITKSGVTITASMNERDETNLPEYLDQQSGWRHPVFGNRHVWVHQSTGGAWFSDTIERGRPVVENRLHEIYEDAAEKIARAGIGR